MNFYISVMRLHANDSANHVISESHDVAPQARVRSHDLAKWGKGYGAPQTTLAIPVCTTIRDVSSS